jgi:nitrous oxidase accessory protein
MTRPADRALLRRMPLIGAAATAVLLLVGAFELPIWRMTLRAPQYPEGLEIVAYGDRVEGDLREINIINHYVGMAKIDTAPAPEMRLWPWAVAGLIVLCLAAPLHRVLAWLAIAATAVTPLAVLADLQWWLHRFGRNLDPAAPFRLEPFTPLALGSSRIGNFESSGSLSWGLGAMLLAAVVLALGWFFSRRPRARTARLAVAAAFVSALVLVTGARPALAETATAASDLQQRIDAVAPGGTLTVDGGVHRGPITVVGPKTLLGRGRPILDGGGSGTVVSIRGDGVVFAGFEVRGGGRTTTQEPAGIKVEGSDHRIEDNVVRDVYFGIHLSKGARNLVRGNRVEPGMGAGATASARPGHGISVWYLDASRLEDNVVTAARDGIYLSFSDSIEVVGNEVSASRYGIHSMYSRRALVEGNRIHDNLLGVALMNSQRLVMRGNTIERHRTGATAYGVLLKDIDDLTMDRNRIVDNRVGLYADSTPIGPDREARVTGNLITGNGAALALQSNVRLVFTDNRVADNLLDAVAEGAGLSERNLWSKDGRGNFWSGYRGYDADRDGIGDLPYRYEAVMNDLVRRDPAAQIFLLTPAMLALENAARMFPLVRPRPLLIDDYPLVEVSR